MQELGGANGAGGAVDMEEGHAHTEQCAERGAYKAACISEQGGSSCSDRFGARAVTSSDDVLIDRGAADRGFAAGDGGLR